MRTVPYIRQPDGVTCGPTCLRMFCDHYGIIPQVTIKEMAVIGETDGTGTCDVRMVKLMNTLGIPHAVGNSRSPKRLAEVIENGGMVLLRTLVHRLKHWILMVKWDADRKTFTMYDPARGVWEATPADVVEIWKPRQHFFFELYPPSKNNVKIERMTESHLAQAEVVAKLGFPKEEWLWEFCIRRCDPELSVVATIGTKVVGIYLLGHCQLRHPKFDNLKGVEGVMLSVLPDYKGFGIGSMLKDYSENLGFDYVWGMQMAALNNLEHWLKRRDLIQTVNNIHYTAKTLK